MSTGPNYPTRDAPYVTPATLDAAKNNECRCDWRGWAPGYHHAGCPAFDAADVGGWGVRFINMRLPINRGYVVTQGTPTMCVHGVQLASGDGYKPCGACFLLMAGRFDPELRTEAVAHDHSERLKIITAERDQLLKDIESGFMPGAYARLSSLQLAERQRDRMRAMLRKLAGECAECNGRGYTFSDDGITGCGPDDREPTREACADCADVREAIGEAP